MNVWRVYMSVWNNMQTRWDENTETHLTDWASDWFMRKEKKIIFVFFVSCRSTKPSLGGGIILNICLTQVSISLNHELVIKWNFIETFIVQEPRSVGYYFVWLHLEVLHEWQHHLQTDNNPKKYFND